MAALPPILLVDDDPDDLFFLRRLITKAGIENKVVSFEDPLGAMDYLEFESHNANPLFVPCALLTDLNMPEKSGLELIDWVRAHERLRHIRILMISDSENPMDKSRAEALGAERFLHKFPTAQVLGELLADLPCTTAPEGG